MYTHGAVFEDPATTALSEEGYQIVLKDHDTHKATQTWH